MTIQNTSTTHSPRKRRAWLIATLIAAMFLTMIPSLISGPSSAQAAACTDNARTLKGVNMDAKYVELRGSSNCGGTAWIRWNYVHTGGDASGTVKFQVMNACGTISNGESNGISTVGGEQSYITAYRSGIVKARMVYKARLGSPASFTSSWITVVGKTTTC